MTKYMYHWCDWGLFDVLEVEVVQENYSWYKDPKDEYSLIKVRWARGDSTCMPCPKKYLFDNYDEAYSFGLQECPGGAF